MGRQWESGIGKRYPQTFRHRAAGIFYVADSVLQMALERTTLFLMK